MPTTISDETLRHLALLYLAVGHGADDYLTDAELNAVVSRLEDRFGAPAADRSIQDVVMETLSVFFDAKNPLSLVRDAMDAVGSAFAPDERAALLHDLSVVARADGVVFQDEQGVLASLAATWDVALPEAALDRVREESPGDVHFGEAVMQDLAFIYLVLGHGTDYELSASERQMMLRRLAVWQPHLNPSQIEAILDEATDRYARGLTDAALDGAIASVKENLPREQRAAALSDLIKIANADGVFLDDEEDLINHLQHEWEVEASANYNLKR